MATARFRLYIATTVDGFIADEGGGVSWLEAYDAEKFGFSKFLQGISTIILGRTTYEQVLAFGDWPYAGKRCYVLASRTLSAPAGEDIHFRGNAGEMLEEIRGCCIGDVWLAGGSRAISSCLAAGVRPSLELFTIPILLGRGIPLWQGHRQTMNLGLAECLTFEDGVIFSRYEPI